MAGHSKWNNIKERKGKNDAKRAKIFTKVGREISVAVTEGGPDPAQNSRLRDLISKAKSMNVPNDNIERVIKKAGDRGGEEYESLIYEGYGPSGVAVVVSALTDNRNRTAGDLRHYFDKYGGALGQTGSVTFQFEQKGIIVIENNGYTEEKIMEDAVDSGADDFEFSGEAIEITTEPNQLAAVRDALAEKGYEFASVEFEYLPNVMVSTDEESKVRMEKLIDTLEDNDDVQNIWHNWEQE